MYFLWIATFFIKLWLYIWINICILNMFHSVLTFSHLTFADKSMKVLGPPIWNQLAKTLRAERPSQTFKRSLHDCFAK